MCFLLLSSDHQTCSSFTVLTSFLFITNFIGLITFMIFLIESVQKRFYTSWRWLACFILFNLFSPSAFCSYLCMLYPRQAFYNMPSIAVPVNFNLPSTQCSMFFVLSLTKFQNSNKSIVVPYTEWTITTSLFTCKCILNFVSLYWLKFLNYMKFPASGIPFA